MAGGFLKIRKTAARMLKCVVVTVNACDWFLVLCINTYPYYERMAYFVYSSDLSRFMCVYIIRIHKNHF